LHPISDHFSTWQMGRAGGADKNGKETVEIIWFKGWGLFSILHSTQGKSEMSNLSQTPTCFPWGQVWCVYLNLEEVLFDISSLKKETLLVLLDMSCI